MTRSRAMRLSLVILVLAFLASAAQAQIGAVVSNWTVPSSSSSSSSSSGLHHSQALADVTNALPFIGVTPCRIVDTRGPAGPYGAPSLPASTPRSFALLGGPCAGLPIAVRAYSLNITVTNTLGAGFISLYPTGGSAPLVSTLNYVAGQTLANAAIVPAGTGGAITAVAGVSGTDLIIDINGYFPTGDSGNLLANGQHFDVSGNTDPLFGMITTRNNSNTTGAMGFLGIAGGASGMVFGSAAMVESSTANGSAGARGFDSTGSSLNGFSNNWAESGVQGVVGANGPNAYGVLGVAIGTSGFGGLFGRQNTTSPFAFTTFAGFAGSSTQAGFFQGNVSIAGTLSKTSGSFKIDHPLDPENKYLYHSFVESPDMMNIYNGVVALDENGQAVVEMPDYFEALNRDYRYQLTSIGRSQPNLFIADEIQNLTFRIAGGKPYGKVSWQVTGIRQDAYANAHRIQVVEAKEDKLRGTYIHPVEHGQPLAKTETYLTQEGKPMTAGQKPTDE